MTQDGTWADESDWEFDESAAKEAGQAPVVAVVGGQVVYERAALPTLGAGAGH